MKALSRLGIGILWCLRFSLHSLQFLYKHRLRRLTAGISNAALSPSSSSLPRAAPALLLEEAAGPHVRLHGLRAARHRHRCGHDRRVLRTRCSAPGTAMVAPTSGGTWTTRSSSSTASSTPSTSRTRAQSGLGR
jgi:hypothetical protein